MKVKVIIVVIVLLLAGGGAGAYFYYDSTLRFTDSFTDCPVIGFRGAATDPESAIGWVTEESLKSLKITEKCGLDCTKKNYMACVIYGIAKQKGVWVVDSPSESQEVLNKACNHGESLACQLEEHARNKVEEEAKAAAQEQERAKYKDVLRDLDKAKINAKQVIAEAKAFHGGREGPMVSGSMTKWYGGTMRYLLYDKPSLYQFHKTGVAVKGKPELKEFVQAKYMGGETEPDFNLIKEFFEKFMRLGVQQIKLDYYVEKKKESEIKNKGYFRAKHCFLFNAGQTYLEVLEMIEQDINYRIEQAG